MFNIFVSMNVQYSFRSAKSCMVFETATQKFVRIK